MRQLKRLCLVALFFPFTAYSFAAAQKGTIVAPLTVDASHAVPAPEPADFQGGTSINPRGETLGMNARYLTWNGKPWLPVMGEFHYTRVPVCEWEEDILKMKAAGVQIVATYVIWIHHEEIEGHFDWTGDRDLRHFVELCARHDMLVYPRIGPWSHGEVRNGGFPDWLLTKTPELRTNDSTYLVYTQRLFDQISKQLKGLLWKDGGPVIGIQLENEYSKRGPGAGEEHILTLKKIALAAGFDVPLYTVTGWDNAVIPRGHVVAVFGGYPDAPWDGSLKELAPAEVYAFRFRNRAAANMGVIGGATSGRQQNSYSFPFMTAEMGGGVQDTYHRRPVIAPDDVTAMMPVMVGSGVNLYGSYMFQGGRNPQGLHTTLQESQATGYPNDLPVKSYDFQAPISEFGEEREVLKKLKVMQYFLNDFGPTLAPMAAFAPSLQPSNPQDLSVARIAVRTDGHSGFLFFNNHVRNATPPPHEGFQVKIKLSDGELILPAQAITLPSGAYGIWPFGLQLGSLQLRYATAQLFTCTEDATGTSYYFVATPGAAPQFVFEANRKVKISTAGKQLAVDGGIAITNLSPALEPVIQAIDGKGHTTRIVLLSQQQAENAWKLHAGDDHLLITNAQYFADDEKVTLESVSDPRFNFSVLPPIAAPRTSTSLSTMKKTSTLLSTFSTTLPHIAPRVQVEQTRSAGLVPAVRLGPAPSWKSAGAAMSPAEEDFRNAAAWKLMISPAELRRNEPLFLTIHYDGDVARLTSGGELLEDNFYNGQPWRIGLSRFRKQIAEHGLELLILPRRVDAPVFIEKQARSEKAPNGQIAALGSVDLEVQYRLDLEFSAVQ